MAQPPRRLRRDQRDDDVDQRPGEIEPQAEAEDLQRRRRGVGETNCGRKARKKSATFGFSMLTSIAARNSRQPEAAAARRLRGLAAVAQQRIASQSR